MRKNTYKNPYETATFCERVKYIRAKRGLSLKDVAEKIYIDPSTLCKWETGEYRMTIENAILLANVLNFSIDELAGLKNDNKTIS